MLAVASTASNESVRVILETVLGPRRAERFAVFAGDVVAAKKPDPSIYRLALERLGTTRDETVVIEDSRNGLLAATGAGLRCVVTVSSYTHGEDFTEAALVVSSLGDPGEPMEVLANRSPASPNGHVELRDLEAVLTGAGGSAWRRAPPRDRHAGVLGARPREPARRARRLQRRARPAGRARPRRPGRGRRRRQDPARLRPGARAGRPPAGRRPDPRTRPAGDGMPPQSRPSSRRSGRPAVGFAGTVTATVPAGAGLSSSAALEVALATALCAVAAFELEPLELAQACRRAELRAVGVPCGILDQAAAVLGQADHAILLDTASLAHRPIPLPPELALVVVDSGVARSLEDGGYAARRRELEQALRALDGRSPRDVAPEELDGLGLDDVPLRRLRHVVTENRRVAEAAAILEEPGTPRLDRLGTLFRERAREPPPRLRGDDARARPARRAGLRRRRACGADDRRRLRRLDRRPRRPRTRAAGLAEAVAAGYRERSGRLATARICRASDGAREL